jgi:hypothetical protein
MKMTSDSKNTKTQINRIAVQLKAIKTMESNANRLGMNELLSSLRQQRHTLTKAINILMNHDDSTSGVVLRWTGWNWTK